MKKKITKDKRIENIKVLEKIMKMHKIKKIYIYFFFYTYKMIKIRAETYDKSGIHTIIVNSKKNKPVI